MTTTTRTPEDIKERIRKCLALTTSPNQGEAAAAAAMVQKLLTQHGLELMDVAEREGGSITTTTGVIHDTVRYAASKFSPLKAWKETLMSHLAWNMGVTHLMQDKTHFLLIGREANVQSVKTLFDWVVTQMQVRAAEGWVEYVDGLDKGVKHVDPLVYRNSFFEAANSRIGMRLWEQREANKKEFGGIATTALVTMTDKANSAYIEATWTLGKPSKARKAGGYSPDGARAGRTAGQNADLGDRKEITA